MRLLVSPAAKILQDLSLVFVYGTLKRGLFNSKVTTLVLPPSGALVGVPPPPKTQRRRARGSRAAPPRKHPSCHT